MLLKKTNEIRIALNNKLYNCALTVALTLPDICGKVECPNTSIAYRYKNWFKKYAEPKFTVSATQLPSNKIIQYTWLRANECYALRCAVLHAGNYDTEKIGLSQLHFHAHLREKTNYSHMVRDSSSADFDVIQLCETLCNAAEEYYENSNNKELFALDEVIIEDW